jgi:hypothetical protein
MNFLVTLAAPCSRDFHSHSCFSVGAGNFRVVWFGAAIKNTFIGKLLCRTLTVTTVPQAPTVIDTDPAICMGDRMYAAFGSTVNLSVRVRGHHANALVTTDDGPVPVVLDPGVPLDQDPAGHLRRILRRRELLSEPAGRVAVRLPAWTLHDPEGSIAGRVHPSEDISTLGSSST